LEQYLKYSYVPESDYVAVAGPDWPSYKQFQQHSNVPEFVYKEIDSMLWNNPAFCVLPFYGFEYPQNTPCCLMTSNGKIKIDQVRLQMLNGQRPNECQHCWKLEDAGIKSDRLIKNETLDFYSGIDLVTLYNDAKNNKNKITHIKIDTSNTCNSTCVTCNSRASSSWGELEKKFLNITPQRRLITCEQADKLLDYESLKSISFRGGEPLLSDTNFYILEKLLEHNNADCFVSFVTNGSIKILKKHRDLVSKFKNMNVSFSIDGIGPVFEYMRYPLKWSQLLENIDFFREKNMLISANYTVSNINILYHQQTTAWFEQNNIPYRIGYVEDLEHFRPSSLPIEIKQYLTSKNKDLDCLLSHTPEDNKNFETMKQIIAQQDQWKSINIKNFLPEFADLVGL
jgi:molybdenum cofactor biosynthesis enzyme MoaA